MDNLLCLFAGNNFPSEASEKNLSPFTKPSRGRNGLSKDKALQTRLVRGAVDSSQRAAFTLAEVLITLGIIGVVAAITMPTLIQNHRKHEIETRLKKVYSTMNQAIEMSIANDSWTPKQSGESDLQYWERALLPYLDGVKVNRSKRTHPYWKNSWVPVELKDGSVFYLASTFIGYDVNGAAGPNKGGIDMFRFRYTYEPKDSTYYKKAGDIFSLATMLMMLTQVHQEMFMSQTAGIS